MFMHGIAAIGGGIINAVERVAEWVGGVALDIEERIRRRRKVRPRYCDLFIQMVALMIYARRQPNVPDEQKTMLRTLIGAAQRILTVDEWLDVVQQACLMLKEHPPIVGHWLDARDVQEPLLGDYDA